jgi:hypothetical protein
MSEATNQASVEAQCIPLRTATMFNTQDCVSEAICDAVPRVNRALLCCQFFTWFHGTYVIVLLFTHTFPCANFTKRTLGNVCGSLALEFHSNRTINVASQPTHRTSITSLTTLRPLHVAFDELTITRNFRAYVPYRTSSKAEDCGKFGKIFVCSPHFKHRFHFSIVTLCSMTLYGDRIYRI